MDEQNKKHLSASLIGKTALIGLSSGVVIAFFRIALSYANQLLMTAVQYGRSNLWFIPMWACILAVVCLLVTRLIRWSPEIVGGGVGAVADELDGNTSSCWWKVLLAKLTASVLCIGCGLSLGREGPSVQLGAAAGAGTSRLWKDSEKDSSLWKLCGISAALSAAFGAPMTGLIFCLEKFKKGLSSYSVAAMLVSSVVSGFLTGWIFGLEPVFWIETRQLIPFHQYLHIVLLGILLGLMGLVYEWCIRFSSGIIGKIHGMYWRMAVPFACACGLAFTLPEVLGDGHLLVEKLADGQFWLLTLCLLFVVKFVFSVISISSGAPGGIFLPLLVMGCMIGGIYYGGMTECSLIAANLFPNFLLLGMAGYFSAVVKIPITGVLLVCEMTGSLQHLLPVLLVSLTAYAVGELVSRRGKGGNRLEQK